MNEASARYRCGKQKRDFRFGKGQCSSLMRHHPGQENSNKEDRRADALVEQMVICCRGDIRALAPAGQAKQVPEKIEVEIKRTDDCTHQVLGLFEAPEP